MQLKFIGPISELILRFQITIAFMYFRIKSRKVVIDNNIQQPLLFCTFINEGRILLLFKSGRFCIVNHALNVQKRVVYQDNIQTQENIIACKRIKSNICAILTKTMSRITFIKYINDQQILIGGIQANQLQVFKNIQTKSQFLVFHNRQFAIMSHSYEFNCTYFTIFNQTQHEFNYDINSKSYPHPINSEGFVIKPLLENSQIAFYKQRFNEFDKILTLVRLKQSLENQEIDLSQLLQEGDLVHDIIVKSSDQYNLFIFKCSNNTPKIQIVPIKVVSIYGKYSIKFEKSHSVAYDNPLYMEILEVNNKNNFYLVKSYAHLSQNGQIYDNFLELRNLHNHQLLERVTCSIKSIDFSPSKLFIVDYSQQISASYQIILHIRTIFSKVFLYGFLLNLSPSMQNEAIRKIHSTIIDLL